MRHVGQMIRLGFVLTTAAPLTAQAQTCESLPPFPPYSYSGSPEGCLCGSPLENLQVTLSSNFDVGAVCDLLWMFRPSDEQVVDLASARVSLDEYTDGDLPWGWVLLSGDTLVSGDLTYEPGDSGELFFTSFDPPMAPVDTAFGREVERLKLTRAYLMQPYSPEEFDVPDTLREAYCWTANVTLRIEDIWVLIGGGDEAGAYPATYTVISATDHRACE